MTVGDVSKQFVFQGAITKILFTKNKEFKENM